MNNTFTSRHEENLESANMLRSKGLCSSSIHCSYYAVYQLILHIIKLKGYRISDTGDSWQKNGSHDRTLTFIYKKLLETNTKTAFRWYRDVESLKRQRHAADYTEVFQDITASSVCYHNALNLSKHLRESF